MLQPSNVCSDLVGRQHPFCKMQSSLPTTSAHTSVSCKQPNMYSMRSTPRITQLCRASPESQLAQLSENADNGVVSVVFHTSTGTTETTAKAGDNIYEVATQCGVDAIVLGCCTGNCGICEIECKKWENGVEGPAVVVRACITPVPPGYEKIEIHELVDQAWGLDGFDT